MCCGCSVQVLPYAAGEFIFGEPGTNGQHSFYQLLHQVRTQSQGAALRFTGMVTQAMVFVLRQHGAAVLVVA